MADTFASITKTSRSERRRIARKLDAYRRANPEDPAVLRYDAALASACEAIADVVDVVRQRKLREQLSRQRARRG